MSIKDERPRFLAPLIILAFTIFAVSAFACGEEAVVATRTPVVNQIPPTPDPSPTSQPEARRVTPTPVSTPAPIVKSELLSSPQATTETSYVLPPPDRDLNELAARLRGADIGELSIEYAEPMSVGDRRDFWLTNLNDGSASEISATLEVVSDNAYWFADDSASVERDMLEEGARLFEERIRPAVVAAFGDIRSPGIDGDPRLIVLHANLNGAAGYYGSSDEYPSEVHPHSNESEIIYIDAEILEPGSDLYMSVLAHEFQHAIHFNQDAGEESWVNEGLSELATEVSGYETESPDVFLPRPDTQLNYWPEEPRMRIAHYGSSALFFRYLTQRIGGTERLRDLMTEPLDGVSGVDSFLARFGLRFEDIFADWVIANYLDADDDKRYGYLDDYVKVRRARPLMEGDGRALSLPQFSARYHTLRSDAAEGALRFQGNSETRQLEADCVSDEGCWWSGRGDSINTKLTREFDLTALDTATLEYMVWHDIEDGWDYGYVEVSDDGGQTWTILDGQHTSDDDVSGNAYGPGYTGRSGEWKRESIDLTPFAGGPALVRFEYVTDDAVYRDGFMVADVSIQELGVESDPDGWVADGFSQARIGLPQRFVVQMIRIGANGGFYVTRINLDGDNFGEVVLSGLDTSNEDVVIVVSPTTADTRHGANYTLEFLPRIGKTIN